MIDVKDKTVTILGAQRSGLAAAKLAASQGANVRLSDCNSEEKLSEEAGNWIKNFCVAVEFGGHTQGFIEQSDLIILSPGVSVNSTPVQWAQSAGVPFLGEIEFAFQYASKPVIAVTGSNGKTTVVNLVHEMLTLAGQKSCLCGNVGFPFSEHVVKDAGLDCYVLEVSSFQMESLMGGEYGCPIPAGFSIKPFSPRVAVLLNISENHLDRHKDMAEYVTAKCQIFLNQTQNDFAVLNGENPGCVEISKNIKAEVFTFDSNGKYENPNVAAAAAAAGIMGVTEEDIGKVLNEFKGVEHRLENIGQIDGITYINDSKSTTPKASHWALSRMDKPVVWICGGRDKNLDFDIGRELVKSKVKCIIAIGEAKNKISSTFEGVVPVYTAESFENGFESARARSEAGDVILLSPMCASFDMFENFEHRGREFKKLFHLHQRSTADA